MDKTNVICEKKLLEIRMCAYVHVGVIVYTGVHSSNVS